MKRTSERAASTQQSQRDPELKALLAKEQVDPSAFCGQVAALAALTEEPLIAQHLADLVSLVVPNSVVAVSSRDATRDELTVLATAGIGTRLGKAITLLGGRPNGMRIRGPMPTEAKSLLSKGTLCRVRGGLYDTVFAQNVPKAVCDKLDEFFGVEQIHTMGFSHGGQIRASMVIFLLKGGRLKIELVEQIGNVAGSALERTWMRLELAERGRNGGEAAAGWQPQALAQTRVGAILVNSEGVIEWCNPAFATLLGFDNDKELVGTRCQNLVSGQDVARECPGEWCCGSTEGFEVSLLRKNGGGVQVRGHSVVLDSAVGQGHVRVVFITGSDSLEVKAPVGGGAVHEPISLVTCAPHPLMIVDLDGKVNEVNDRAVKLLMAASADELRGRGWTDFVSTDLAATSVNFTSQLNMKSGELSGRPAVVKSLNGSEIPCSLWTRLAADPAGHICGIAIGMVPSKTGSMEGNGVHDFGSSHDDAPFTHVSGKMSGPAKDEPGASGREQQDHFMSLDEVAAWLGIQNATVYKWIQRRGLPGHKVGWLWRFKRGEVEVWLASQEKKKNR